MAQVAVENPMRRIKILKVVLNSSIGEGGVRLEKAAKILESITGQKPSYRRAKKTIRGFGIHKGEPIAVMVTLRGEKAVEILRKTLAAIGNRLSARCFDEQGNFSFGIKEHLDIPGTRYDPELGIIGMDVAVNIGRPGYRVAYRRSRRSRIGTQHRVTPSEAQDYIRNTFGIEIIGEEES